MDPRNAPDLFAGLEDAPEALAQLQLRKGKLVGARGFEPPTPCAQGRCATRLRYAPTEYHISDFKLVSLICFSLPALLKFSRRSLYRHRLRLRHWWRENVWLRFRSRRSRRINIGIRSRPGLKIGHGSWRGTRWNRRLITKKCQKLRRIAHGWLPLQTFWMQQIS